MESNFAFGINASDSPSPDLVNTLLNESETCEESSNCSLNDIYSPANETDSLEWWQAFDSKYHIFSPIWTAIYALSYFVILTIGIFGNGLVILTYILRPKMRTVTNLFIMNLAVADFLAVLFCFLGNLLSNTIRPWILGWFMCKMVAYVQGMSVCASAYLLAAIAVDRCKAVYRPLDRPPGLRRTHAIGAVLVIWFVAIVLPLPWAFALETFQKKSLTFCAPLWEDELHGHLHFILVNVFAFYLLPSGLIIVINLMIWCRLNRRQVPQASASADAIRLMHRQTRNGARKMLGIVTVAFMFSWLPLYVFMIRYKYFEMGATEKRVMHVVLPFVQWLASCNSTVNPIIYAFLNAKFRAAFKSLMPSCLQVCWRGVPLTPATRPNNNVTMSSDRIRLQTPATRDSLNSA